MLAGSAIRLFGWDITNPDTMAEVNTNGSTEFKPRLDEAMREQKWQGWHRAVDRSKGWEEGVEGDQ